MLAELTVRSYVSNNGWIFYIRLLDFLTNLYFAPTLLPGGSVHVICYEPVFLVQRVNFERGVSLLSSAFNQYLFSRSSSSSWQSWSSCWKCNGFYNTVLKTRQDKREKRRVFVFKLAGSFFVTDTQTHTPSLYISSWSYIAIIILTPRIRDSSSSSSYSSSVTEKRG